MNANRLRPVAFVLVAVALTAVLTGCREDGSAAGADAAPSAGAKATPSPSTTAGKPGAAPSAGAT
ncbi:MAG TPA: N-acetylmuramoyl-L-alanine amidase, partial [Streptomyces sp.]|nr:N-acetylmuramoyl-L-alanine amidase [Streptomyces sp.]